MTSTKPKIGFYPCCSSDILEPLAMLEDYVDEMIFCDIRDTPTKKVNSNKHKKPIPIFLKGDVRETIGAVELIDLLFYRRDTGGEGGSGVWVLGDSFLPRILARFNPKPWQTPSIPGRRHPYFLILHYIPQSSPQISKFYFSAIYLSSSTSIEIV